MRNLITAQEVIELAFAENSNMMAESISDTAIRIAEIKYIRPAFGVMYPLLADKYADFTNDYVKPALAYFVKCEIVSSIAIDMSNSGVAVANPQYQSAATDKQRQRLYDSEMSKAKTLLDFALSYIAENKEFFPDFSGDAPKKHHRLGGILLGGVGVSRGQSASITGDAFKAEFDKYIKEMGETAEEVEQLIESTDAITEEAKKAINNANIATKSAQDATENANKAGAKAVRIATESANNATTAKENAENATEQAKVATANANSAAQRANEEVQNLREKADTEGYYPNMSVGMADNLVGRGDIQDAQINFRPSGGVPEVGNGMNITDGTARIKAIKGNSVVVNQRLATLFSPNITGNTITSNGITFTKENDGYFLVSGSNTSGQTALSNNTTANYNFSIGHKYLFLVDGPQKSVIQAYLLTSQTSYRFSGNGIITAVADENVMVRILVSNNVVDVDERVRCAIIDLTKMFSVGNEPDTVEEFYARKPIGVDEFAYNEGKLVDMKVDELESTGDNAYNPIEHQARVIGGQKYHITDSANTEDLFVTFYAFYEDDEEEREIEPIIEDGKKYYIFPANGYCIVNGQVGEICVCLEHSYEKPIKPYEVNVKDFSFIKEIATEQGELLFQNGMRSTGSVYDEIHYDVTKKKWVAVKRVEGRAFAEGDAEDTTVKTDGSTTNYPLAEPIVVEIPNSENWNLDYLVWDFGTELSLVRDSTIDKPIPSAPFRANINYEPNAVDDLRWSIKYIRALEQRVLALEQKVVQEANNEEV